MLVVETSGMMIFIWRRRFFFIFFLVMEIINKINEYNLEITFISKSHENILFLLKQKNSIKNTTCDIKNILFYKINLKIEILIKNMKNSLNKIIKIIQNIQSNSTENYKIFNTLNSNFIELLIIFDGNLLDDIDFTKLLIENKVLSGFKELITTIQLIK
jgi:hypothetical protein